MSGESPSVVLYDSSGNPVGVVLEGVIYKLQAQVTGAAANNAAVSGNPVLIAGSDGTSVHTLATDAKGDGYAVLTSPLALSGQYATVTPYGALKISEEATTLLEDKFDQTSLDSVTWSTLANLVPTGISLTGNLQITTGTVAFGYSIVYSNPTFVQEAGAYLQFGTTLQFEYPVKTNMHRFWGFGTGNQNTTTAPLQDAVGFELDTSGNLNAAVYSGGTKIYSQVLTNPANGSWNRYSLTWRTDKVYFFVNTTEFPVATATYQIPQQQSLPIRLHVINASTPPTSGAVFKIAAVGAMDTGRNNITISDSKYAWQQLSIDATGAIPLQESGIDGSTAPQRAVQLGATSPQDGILRALNAITDGGKQLAVQDESAGDLLRGILRELRIISFYLSQMADIDLTDLE